MRRQPPRSKRTETLLPYSSLFRYAREELERLGEIIGDDEMRLDGEQDAGHQHGEPERGREVADHPGQEMDAARPGEVPGPEQRQMLADALAQRRSRCAASRSVGGPSSPEPPSSGARRPDRKSPRL